MQRRITPYRKAGLITRQVAVLDPTVVSGAVLAGVFVTLERESIRAHEHFRNRMRHAPEVQQCYSLAGEQDYLIMVVANGMSDCRDTVDGLFMDDDNVKKYTTHIVFDVVKTGLANSRNHGHPERRLETKGRWAERSGEPELRSVAAAKAIHPENT